MIRRVPGHFVSGDAIAYIPKIGGGFHPILFNDESLYICDSILRNKIISSVKIEGKPLSWEYHGSVENEDETYLPKKPITSPFGYGTIILLLSGGSLNYLVGFKLPTANQLSSQGRKQTIEKKFQVETACEYIIGMTPASSPNCPDITLQDENRIIVNHHNVADGRLLSEQKFKQKTIFPSHVKCTKRQIGFNGTHLLAFTTDSGKYDFLWPKEIPRGKDDSSLWRLEWDERSGLVNLFDGYRYNIIDMQKKEIVARKDIEEIGFGLNSTMYESYDDGVFWVRRYIKEYRRDIAINKICEGEYEAIDFIRSEKYGDLFLFGHDEDTEHSACLFIPDSTTNEVKIIELTGLAEPIFHSELIAKTGELHLFSENNHYATAPLEKLI